MTRWEITKDAHEFAMNEIRKLMTNSQKFINGELLIPADFSFRAFDMLRDDLRLCVKYPVTPNDGGEQEEQNQAALATLRYEQLPQILRLQGDAQANTYRNQVLKEASEELTATREALRVAREALEFYAHAPTFDRMTDAGDKAYLTAIKIKELMGEK